MGLLPRGFSLHTTCIHAWYEVLWPALPMSQLEGRGCPTVSLSRWERAARVPHSTRPHVPLRPRLQHVLSKYLMNEQMNERMNVSVRKTALPPPGDGRGEALGPITKFLGPWT